MSNLAIFTFFLCDSALYVLTADPHTSPSPPASVLFCIIWSVISRDSLNEMQRLPVSDTLPLLTRVLLSAPQLSNWSTNTEPSVVARLHMEVWRSQLLYLNLHKLIPRRSRKYTHLFTMKRNGLNGVKWWLNLSQHQTLLPGVITSWVKGFQDPDHIRYWQDSFCTGGRCCHTDGFIPTQSVNTSIKYHTC